MSEALKRLLMRGRYMAPLDDEGSSGGSAADDLDDEDEENEDEDSTPPAEKQKEDGDEFTVEIEGEEDEHKAESKTGEQEAEGAETDDREKIREQRRKERADRKVRQKEKEDSTKRELAAERRARQELEQRLASLEGRDRSRELAQVDEGVNRAGRSYDHWKAKFSEAMEQHDGAAAALATEKMLESREAERQLKTMKVAIEKSQTQQGRPASNPVVINHAQKFVNENQWYKHGSNEDADSRIVAMLDQDLAREGWDPANKEYWDELNARVKKYLPHRIAGGKVSTVDNTKAAPRQNKAVVGGGGGETAPSGKAVFKLSAQRVQALKDAGMWNDLKQREAAIKRFRDFDKTNGKKG